MRVFSRAYEPMGQHIHKTRRLKYIIPRPAGSLAGHGFVRGLPHSVDLWGPKDFQRWKRAARAVVASHGCWWWFLSMVLNHQAFMLNNGFSASSMISFLESLVGLEWSWCLTRINDALEKLQKVFPPELTFEMWWQNQVVTALMYLQVKAFNFLQVKFPSALNW